MFFRNVLAVAILAFSMPIYGAPIASVSSLGRRIESAGQTIAELQSLLPLVATAQTAANNIKADSGIIDTTTYEPLIQAFQALITQMTIYIPNEAASTPITDVNEEQQVLAALKAFTTAQDKLMTTMIGKSGITQSLFLGPVAAVLRSYEQVFDTYVPGVIDIIPDVATQAKSAQATSDKLIAEAVCAYTPVGSLGLNLFC